MESRWPRPRDLVTLPPPRPGLRAPIDASMDESPLAWEFLSSRSARSLLISMVAHSVASSLPVYWARVGTIPQIQIFCSNPSLLACSTAHQLLQTSRFRKDLRIFSAPLSQFTSSPRNILNGRITRGWRMKPDRSSLPLRPLSPFLSSRDRTPSRFSKQLK